MAAVLEIGSDDAPSLALQKTNEVGPDKSFSASNQCNFLQGNCPDCGSNSGYDSHHRAVSAVPAPTYVPGKFAGPCGQLGPFHRDGDTRVPFVWRGIPHCQVQNRPKIGCQSSLGSPGYWVQ